MNLSRDFNEDSKETLTSCPMFCHGLLQIRESFYPNLPLADSPTQFLGDVIPAVSVSETPDEFAAAVQTETEPSFAAAPSWSREM